MGEPVEQSSCHFSVAKYLGPFTDAEVSLYDDTGALVELAQKVEQQRAAGRAERQIAKFVKDDPVDLGEPLSQVPCLSEGLFLFQCVDECDG